MSCPVSIRPRSGWRLCRRRLKQKCPLRRTGFHNGAQDGPAAIEAAGPSGAKDPAAPDADLQGRPEVSPRACMISVMADIIGASDDFDGDRLNDSLVWRQFMQTVLDRMETYPDEDIRLVLDTIDREQFQEWIDERGFWDELNHELDRRAQLLMTVLPWENQGHC